VGVQNVSWDLEHGSHMHGAYQRLLHALAESGVLIGVASKNDPQLVAEAFLREDLLLPASSVYPVEASWGQKSEAVGRILKSWNIAADSVVFIDDSSMELAEVKAGHPGIETILFPKNDHQALNQLFQNLRDLFGKSYVSTEDSIRSQSIRHTSARLGDSHTSHQSLDKFLEQAEARFTFDFEKVQADDRALELINKTNQFNLNGRRITEPLWRQFLKENDSFVATVSYQDKYGPLGKIAVLAGRVKSDTVRIETWVMSCRAFSRRVEHRSLEEVIDHFGAKKLIFEFESTVRNGPLQKFFRELTGAQPTGNICLTKNQIRSAAVHREPAGVAND
jgi:FkbH-like protein